MLNLTQLPITQNLRLLKACHLLHPILHSKPREVRIFIPFLQTWKLRHSVSSMVQKHTVGNWHSTKT